MDPQQARNKIYQLMEQPKKMLFGVDLAIRKLVVALFTLVPYSDSACKKLGQAHVLLMDTPGVGKTDLIRSIACAIGADWTLVQGHPLMMPSEVMGDEIYNNKLGKFLVRKGKIFTNVFLFDEINRAHPKTQSAFLQAMEERIAIVETTDIEKGQLQNKYYPLHPIANNNEQLFFWVLATANPIESEGTFPLPEAQLDRFTFSFSIGYPNREQEKKIRLANVYHTTQAIEITKTIDLQTILEIAQTIASTVKMQPIVSDYLMRLIENSRPQSANSHLTEFINKYVEVGISPRANYHFEAGARTWAFVCGQRNYISIDDIKQVAPDIMRHRLVLSPQAQGEGISADDVVQKIIDNTRSV